METDNSSEGTFFDTERSCYAQADTADPLGESSAVQVVPSGVLRMSYSAKSVTPGEIFFVFCLHSILMLKTLLAAEPTLSGSLGVQEGDWATRH